MKVSLLACGGGDTYYELGLLSGLVDSCIKIDFIGSDFLHDSKVLTNSEVTFYNLRGNQNSNVPIKKKIFRILKFYNRIIKYAFITDSKLFHIQWTNKFVHFDRTLLNIYYKVLGKKLVFTAHNINAGIRDGNDYLLNRLTLKCMYKIVDHVIVHTPKMKKQLIENYKINVQKITVIPYGINNLVHKTNLTPNEARERLDLSSKEKIILYFGFITPYKGLEYLLLAIKESLKKHDDLKLIIAGKTDTNYSSYWQKICGIIKKNNLEKHIIKYIEFIPDEDIEVYFKAADVLILPYKYIFQSGVLFLSLNFGLPIIASDVGSLREYITSNKAGFIFKSQDYVDLTKKIDLYFNSTLFKKLNSNRKRISTSASKKYSWDKIGKETRLVYEGLENS